MDGDLQEFNKSAATLVAVDFTPPSCSRWSTGSGIPAWPVADSFTRGIGTVTYQRDGKEVTTHWNTRAELIEEMQTGSETLKQQAYLQKVAAASYDEIVNDPDMMAFTRFRWRRCCSPTTVRPATGWRYTGQDRPFIPTCVTTPGCGVAISPISRGPFARDATASCRRSARCWPRKARAAGELCAEPVRSRRRQCQGGSRADDLSGAGRWLLLLSYRVRLAPAWPRRGAANLTDAIWTVADVPGAADDKARIDAVEAVVRDGVHRQMPAWSGRLDDTQIKLLTVYVQSLGI